MLTTACRIIVALFISFTLAACGDKAPRMEMEINVTMNGKLVPHAKIMMDGKLLGETGADGQFISSMKLQPGKQALLEASAETIGFEVQPWQSKFTVKLPNESEVLKYVFDADLKATPFVVIAVLEKGVAVAGATVRVDKHEVGKTDEAGSLVYKYQSASKQTAAVEVTKSGYSTWSKVAKLEPGIKLGVEIFKRIAITLEAVKEEYGSSVGIPGIAVTVGNKKAGKTNDLGELIFNYEGESDKPVKVTFSAPGYLPSKWSTTVALEGGAAIRHTFYPVNSKPIKVAFFHFGGNTPGVDLREIAGQTQNAMRTQLFKHAAFREVSAEVLDKEIKSASTNITKLSSKGWQHTRLQSLAEMIVVGSVSQDAKGYIIEVKFHSSSGKIIYSQLIHADDKGDINNVCKEIAANIIDRFPFEGTVIGSKDDRYEVNLGKPYAISRGAEFEIFANASGKVAASNGVLTVKRVNDNSVLTALEDGQVGIKVAAGDRVVRRLLREGESRGKQENFNLVVKGGVGKDATPLSGVNIYLNTDWVGTTSTDGRAKVAIRTGNTFNLMLYRHGYQQVLAKIKVDQNGDNKQFVMPANYAVFKVDSTPSPATVYVDGELLGKSPLLDGKVGLGFHTVRLSAGESYRDWEEVVEFDKKLEDRTGARKITLYKDFMKIGEAAEIKGDVDAAIAAYAATVNGHPDFSEAHHRLAQLYLDEKNDYDSAIKEFENVLTLPENEQLIYKQYAVAYTNLGHAYYEKGNDKMTENRNEAAQFYSKALQNLKISKQNTRFFPAAEYDQAVHDTYFYLALSYQKLFMISNRANMLSDANLAWRDYFDFFPRALEGDPVFAEHRDTAKKFWDQIKDK